MSRSLDQALVGGSEGKEEKDTTMRVNKSKNSEKIIKQAYEEVSVEVID